MAMNKDHIAIDQDQIVVNKAYIVEDKDHIAINKDWNAMKTINLTLKPYTTP